MENRKDRRLRLLVEQLYEAVGDASAWSGLALRIAETFDSSSAVLKMHDTNGLIHLVDTTDNLQFSSKKLSGKTLNAFGKGYF